MPRGPRDKAQGRLLTLVKQRVRDLEPEQVHLIPILCRNRLLSERLPQLRRAEHRAEDAQDKEAATAARLEGLLMAACASPVDDWGLQGSVALPSYAVSPATHPTDMAASSCPVQEGGEWPLQLFAAARKRAAASYDGDVLAYLTQLASVEAEHARALQALNAVVVLLTEFRLWRQWAVQMVSESLGKCGVQISCS